MAQAIQNPQDCCTPCSTTVTVNIPGPAGANGTNGAAGASGQNAWTTLLAGFTMPAEGATVTANVAATAWMVPRQGTVQGILLEVQFAGVLEVISITDATHVVVKNIAVSASGIYPANAAPGAAIPIGALVTPTGIQGPTGVIPGGALLSANNLSDVASAAASRGNLGLGSAALRTAGVANGDAAVIDDVAFNNGEMLRATAAGVESIPAATARTSLGLGTMATQASNAVSITGGAVDGTAIGGVTPAAAKVTTLAASSDATLSGKLFSPVSATQSLLAATSVSPNAGRIKVVGNGGPVTLTATPTITNPVADGQHLIIQGNDNANTVTFQDEASLAGTKLKLGAATRALGKGDTLQLVFDLADGFWYELGFVNVT